jgi:hypothetical protein
MTKALFFEYLKLVCVYFKCSSISIYRTFTLYSHTSANSSYRMDCFTSKAQIIKLIISFIFRCWSFLNHTICTLPKKSKSLIPKPLSITSIFVFPYSCKIILIYVDEASMELSTSSLMQSGRLVMTCWAQSSSAVAYESLFIIMNDWMLII